ncbi:hypothetical protein ILYODFUR_036355 [Ilyodon furcidens]|uniref:Uncharacterized protein n=1 Tax=Ilyodon furcidens TaxID=33524 RepID=A0ABV0TE17_9TELE
MLLRPITPRPPTGQRALHFNPFGHFCSLITMIFHHRNWTKTATTIKTVNVIIILKPAERFCSPEAKSSTNISRRPGAATIRTMARTSHQHNKFMSKIKFGVI